MSTCDQNACNHSTYIITLHSEICQKKGVGGSKLSRDLNIYLVNILAACFFPVTLPFSSAPLML